ncbi:hypothetical protein ACEE21_14555 [Clostridium baratii]
MDKKELSLEKEVLGVVKHVNGISSLVLSNRGNVSIRDLENLANTFTEYSNLFKKVYAEEKRKRGKESIVTLGKEIDLGISNISCRAMSNTELLTEKDLASIMDECDRTVKKIDKYEKLCSERGIMNKYMGVKQFFVNYKKSLGTLINLKTGKGSDEADLVDMVSFILNSF